MEGGGGIWDNRGEVRTQRNPQELTAITGLGKGDLLHDSSREKVGQKSDRTNSTKPPPPSMIFEYALHCTICLALIVYIVLFFVLRKERANSRISIELNN